jgi:methylase of polypeptide subunit release factors
MSTRRFNSQVSTSTSLFSRDLLTPPPRPETEAYTSHLAELLISGKLDEFLSAPAPEIKQGDTINLRPQLSILDVCSGSGCISLLLHSLLSKSGKFPDLRTLGLDISPQAVALANENLALNIQRGHFPVSDINNEAEAGSRLKRKKAREAKFAFFPPDKVIHFAKHDIFTSLTRSLGNFSIIISNPPYISSSSFARETTRSVRLYEPKLALVPDPEKYSSLKNKSAQAVASKSGTDSSYQTSKPESPAPKTQTTPLELNPADTFYHRLLRLSTHRSAKILLMEVGDSSQALRVLKLALSRPHIAKSNKFEIWRDFPGQSPQPGKDTVVDINGQLIPVKGAGSIRSVVLFRIPSALKGEQDQKKTTPQKKTGHSKLPHDVNKKRTAKHP